MASYFLPEILLSAVQAFLSAGRTEGRDGSAVSKRGLEDAERRLRGSVDTELRNCPGEQRVIVPNVFG